MKLSRLTLNFIKQDDIFIGSIGYDACSVNKSLKNFTLTLDTFLFLKNIYLTCRIFIVTCKIFHCSAWTL